MICDFEIWLLVIEIKFMFPLYGLGYYYAYYAIFYKK